MEGTYTQKIIHKGTYIKGYRQRDIHKWTYTKGYIQKDIYMKGAYTRNIICTEEIYIWRGYIYKGMYTRKRHTHRRDIYTETT